MLHIEVHTNSCQRKVKKINVNKTKGIYQTFKDPPKSLFRNEIASFLQKVIGKLLSYAVYVILSGFVMMFSLLSAVLSSFSL